MNGAVMSNRRTGKLKLVENLIGYCIIGVGRQLQ